MDFTMGGRTSENQLTRKIEGRMNKRFKLDTSKTGIPVGGGKK